MGSIPRLLLRQGFHDLAGTHRQLAHARAGGTINGVSDRRHGRDNGYLADAPQAIRMPWVWDLHDYRFDHGQVQARRHAIVKEAGVEHLALVIEDILFVERPADALDHPTLDLSFHVTRMDSFTSILESGVAQDLGLAGLGVDFHIDDMDRKARAWASWGHVSAADDGAAGGVQSARQLPERHPQLWIFTVCQGARGILDVFGRYLPNLRRALDHLPPDV